MRLVSQVALSGVIVMALAGCNHPDASLPAKPTSVQLSQLGFYAVIDGESQYSPFKEYGAGDTYRSLPVSDFPEFPTLSSKDYLLLYGPLPEQPMGETLEVFRYELAGNIYEHRSADASIEGFFSRISAEGVNGQPVLKLQPNPTAKPGTYFLYKYVGMNGDAYLGFRLAQQ
jgi:hypothetical protein